MYIVTVCCVPTKDFISWLALAPVPTTRTAMRLWVQLVLLGCVLHAVVGEATAFSECSNVRVDLDSSTGLMLKAAHYCCIIVFWHLPPPGPPLWIRVPEGRSLWAWGLCGQWLRPPSRRQP